MKRFFSLFLILSLFVIGYAQDAPKKDEYTQKVTSFVADQLGIIQGRIFNTNLSFSILGGTKDRGYMFQDFETATFPPANWAIEYTGTVYWTRVTGASGFGLGTASAKFAFYSASAGVIQSLVTETFTPAIAGDLLKFDHAYAPYTNYELDKMTVEYSINGGTSWDTLKTYHGGNGGELNTAAVTSSSYIPAAGEWATKSIALPLGTNKIRFKAISAYGNNLYIDNITIGTPPAADAGVFSLDMNANNLPGVIVPKATIKNFGSATQTFPVTFTITPGGYTSTKTVTALAPGASIQVTFDNWTATEGSYTAKAKTNLTGDANPLNDEITASINITTATWLSGLQTPVPTYMGMGATVVRNDTTYVFSMGGNSTLKTEVVRYNVNANTWTQVASLPIARLIAAATAIKDTVYVIGGSDGTAYSNTLYKYNVVANTWTTGPALPVGTHGWGKAVSYQDSLIYVVGGNDGTNYLASVWVFNTNTQTWRPGTDLPIAIFGGACAIYNGQIIFVGGATSPGIVATTYVGTISGTDRSVITWEAKTPYPGGTRYRWDAAPFGTKGIIVAGGSSSSTWSGSNETYTYLPSTDTWTPCPPKTTMSLGSSVGSAKIGNTLKYVVVSGYDGANIMTANEIFAAPDLIPVELTAFTADVNKNGVELRWSTATETNNSGFQVERKSSNGSFEAVGFVKGNGTTTEAVNYVFTDKVNDGVYTYRLKQVDFDGTFEYSKAVEVNATMPKTFGLEQNYPNPFNPSTIINFSLAVDSRVSFKIFNVLGQEVYAISNTMNAGNHSINFNASGITSGVYFYQLDAKGVDGSNYSSVKKMMLTK